MASNPPKEYYQLKSKEGKTHMTVIGAVSKKN